VRSIRRFRLSSCVQDLLYALFERHKQALSILFRRFPVPSLARPIVVLVVGATGLWEKEKALWGNDQDTHAFDRFIRRFLTKYERWNSPKYLIGESYGTLRNAQLVASLQFVHLNGIVTLSQILDFNHNAN